MLRRFWILAIVNVALGAAACATGQAPKQITSTHQIEPARPRMSPPTPAEGSIWSPRTSANLYADLKARNVGDIVTINIIESAKASKNATTTTARDSSLAASWSGVLAKLTGDWVGSDQAVHFKNDFDGKGETTRSSQLNAYITAQVIHVLPNGNLVIRGSRQVQVNNENQFINISGVIRPEDISSNNIVLSTFIADATIELTGQGVISDNQRPGWLARILNWIWPF
jgi:flagellar L-ring protein precursor FlgH